MFDNHPEIQQSLIGLLYSSASIDINTLEKIVQRADNEVINPLTLLLQEKVITEDSLAVLMVDIYGIERGEWVSETDPNMLALSAHMPIDYMQENFIVPLKVKGNTLKIGLVEPTALGEIGNVRVMTGMNIETVIITYSEIVNALNYYRNDAANSSDKTATQRSDIQSKSANQSARGRGGNTDGEEIKSDVVQFVDKILADAIGMGVSDIHVEPFKEKATLRYRVDGVLRYIDTGNFLHEHFPAVSTRLKIMASLDIAERRLAQDGAIYFASQGKEVDIRVSVLPVQNGERIVMRLLDRSSISLSLESLNLGTVAFNALDKAINSPQGMILVTGPTGSGKSTTLYSCVNRINREGINILTAEDPIEYNIDGIGQVQVNESIGRSFASVLRSFLRQDPEVILVGEIRDQETAEISVKASLTGHLVLSTLHTNSALETVGRLIDMGIPAYLLTNSLSLVVAQRLARKTCEHCAIEDPSVTATVLRSLGATEEMVMTATPKEAKGCKQCNKLGYKGRQGLYEVLTISRKLREALLISTKMEDLLDIAKTEGFRTLQEMGLQMLCDGKLTAQEYQRVIAI